VSESGRGSGAGRARRGTPVDADGGDPPRVDGRAARSARTRLRVVEALLALVEEGDVRPTAHRVAERAGVSLRSIFHHFDDMDALLMAAADVQQARSQGLLHPIDPDTPLAARVDALVGQRAELFEAVAPVRRAALHAEASSPALAERIRQIRALMRAQTESLFAAELDAAADRAGLLEQLDVLTSWDLWEALRVRQGLGVDAARETVVALLGAVLATTGAST
jgi:TetR/AcrR family transcriptional regulator, regulator of autoinduction and epiphytic fitness